MRTERTIEQSIFLKRSVVKIKLDHGLSNGGVKHPYLPLDKAGAFGIVYAFCSLHN
jgi:hypothetical protein